MWSSSGWVWPSLMSSTDLVSRSGRRVNAKSIMGVMMLAAGLGSSVTIDADGPDAEQALAALRELIADKFGEGE